MSYRDFPSYGAAELDTFLRAVDKHMTRQARIVILGGAAAALHDSTVRTRDVDTYERPDPDLEHAFAAASLETGLEIPVGHASVAQMPYCAEDRFERRLADLRQLEVLVLEKHDLVLSKVIRYVDHDEQQIGAIHRAVGLDYDVLVRRFIDEMGPVFAEPTRLRAQFLQLIEALFGEDQRQLAVDALDARGR